MTGYSVRASRSGGGSLHTGHAVQTERTAQSSERSTLGGCDCGLASGESALSTQKEKVTSGKVLK